MKKGLFAAMILLCLLLCSCAANTVGTGTPVSASTPAQPENTSVSSVAPAASRTAAAASTVPDESTLSEAATTTSKGVSTPVPDQKTAAANELTNILESIDRDVTIGKGDSHMTAVHAAADLLNWGVGTEKKSALSWPTG